MAGSKARERRPLKLTVEYVYDPDAWDAYERVFDALSAADSSWISPQGELVQAPSRGALFCQDEFSKKRLNIKSKLRKQSKKSSAPAPMTRLNKKTEDRESAFTPSQPPCEKWVPRWDLSGNELRVKRRIKPVYFVLPEPTKATLGVRLRFLRRQAGLTIEQLSRRTGVSQGAIARLERNEVTILRPWVLGRIIPFLSQSLKQAFPESGGDPYDFLVPPVSFGKWLRNQRMRLALQVKDFAARLGVKEYTVIRYEADQSRPNPAIRQRLRRLLKLDAKPLLFLKETLTPH